MKLIEIKPSTNPDKKYMAVFDVDGHTKTTHFGSKPYQDYTQHRSKVRKMLYLLRHRANENWNDPTSAGALSRWLLWNKPTMSASIQDFKRRFNI